MFCWKINENAEMRLLEERHAEALFLLADQNRAYLREWLPRVFSSLEETRKFIRENLEQFTTNRGFGAGIWWKKELAGFISLREINWSDRYGVISYWLGASYQGHGLVTASCRAIINYGFGELGLNRLEMQCGETNQRSRAIPEKLGFTQEGKLRQAQWLYDHYIDLVIYGLLASEWRMH
jgi:ribosomal-protein-serine acetyltransferase